MSEDRRNTDHDVCELSIGEMARLMRTGATTSTELVVAYLNRLFHFDLNGIRLNSTPIIARDTLSEAMSRDAARARGEASGDLFGVPYTVKDSYMVRGMTMAAGSPAFVDVVAGEDCFSVEALRRAGAVLIGRTNMPPMAAGGVQRGIYGRSENPYNGEYLSAAWYSGSSNGSAVSTASSFAAFGLGEETVSSGRSPAANNGLVAYTPSRGVISLRGNWPLHATKDEVVPHTRTVADMLRLLPALTVEDRDTRGDMWRWQRHVPLDGARRVREKGLEGIEGLDVLSGLRIGVVNEYAGRMGGRVPSVYTRPSISVLLLDAIHTLERAGAQVRWTNLPLRDLYEIAPRTLESFAHEGLIPRDWMSHEWLQLNAAVLEEFIRGFSMSGLHSLLDVDPDDIFPNPLNSVAYRRGWRYGFYREANEFLRSGRMVPAAQTPELSEGLRGLEEIRCRHLERWMEAEGLDILVFPTNSNVARADADVDDVDNTEAWQDGTWFSNGNRMIRHLGIPTVSVGMGIMSDTGVPAGLTFMGPSGSDRTLLACAYEYEQARGPRVAPRRTPSIAPAFRIAFPSDAPTHGGVFPVKLHASVTGRILRFGVASERSDDRFACRVFINGVLMREWGRDDEWEGEISVARFFDARKVGIVALATGTNGGVGADVAVMSTGYGALGAGSLI